MEPSDGMSKDRMALLITPSSSRRATYTCWSSGDSLAMSASNSSDSSCRDTRMHGDGAESTGSHPSDISAAGILKVCEGPITPLSCLDKDCTPCPRASSCPSHHFWAGLQSVISDYLSAISLDNLKNSDFITSEHPHCL
ncbi:MAG: Rrf2 family transcriptional regulator [Akkermansia sp.]|nr:Rrf2 family transcriptional regulator [Akkermansia sp.]